MSELHLPPHFEAERRLEETSIAFVKAKLQDSQVEQRANDLKNAVFSALEDGLSAQQIDSDLRGAKALVSTLRDLNLI